MNVSISAYNDGDLLQNALESVTQIMPDANIQVVDGKYETFKPDAAENSTDNTEDIAKSFNARYIGGGPYGRERDKHIHRVELSPDDELTVFMDADERLLTFDRDALPERTAISPRIFNALVYGPHAVYWPRVFKPGWVATINRWDAYLFDVSHERSDAVTILHRHDLRDREYREAKYERFAREDRTGRYDDDYEMYLADDWDATFRACPGCGRDSVTESQVTNFGEEYSHVECCIAADGCHAAVREVDVGEWRYLPDDWRAGWENDAKRLRLELMDAGCTFVRTASVDRMVREMEPAVALWVESEFGEAESEVFA